MNKSILFLMVIGSMPLMGALAPKPGPVPMPKPVYPEQKSTPVDEVKLLGTELSIGLPEQSCVELSAALNKLLSDEYLIYVKTQNYHWNIRNSMNFNDLHLFFGKQYDMLAGIVDEVAERVRALGGRTFGTMSEFIKNSQLKEDEGMVPVDKDMIKNLLDDHESIIRSLRPIIAKSAELQDSGTNNLLSGLIEKHEKMAWMLRSYLK